MVGRALSVEDLCSELFRRNPDRIDNTMRPNALANALNNSYSREQGSPILVAAMRKLEF